MKYKTLLILSTLILLIFGFGITYSFFSTSKLGTIDQKVATFIFNAEEVDKLNLPILNLNPGEDSEYAFSVSNSKDTKISNVTIEYQMIVKTYHLVPLTIELYKVEENGESLILTCNETYSRNESNELICNSNVEELNYKEAKENNYKLKVTFPSEYSDKMYSNLVDYINIEIKSWQKT